MTVVNLIPPATLADGEPAIADDVSSAFRQMEGLFQSNVHEENFSKGPVLRGRSFRKNGFSEVFSRKTTAEHWSLFCGRGSHSYDIPGGALRFRLRYPAEVLVFFSATIFRLNKYDGFPGMSGDGRVPARHSWIINGIWEGGDDEPGSEYIQARTMVRDKSYVAKGDTSRGVFLPWSIRPLKVTVGSSAEPADEVLVPKDLEDVRMISQTGVLGLASPSEVGRLQAGWHNIRHTAQWDKNTSLYATNGTLYGGFGYEMNHLDTAHTMVFGNTELVVVANYGRRADDRIVIRTPTADPFAVPPDPPSYWTSKW